MRKEFKNGFFKEGNFGSNNPEIPFFISGPSGKFQANQGEGNSQVDDNLLFCS